MLFEVNSICFFLKKSSSSYVRAKQPFQNPRKFWALEEIMLEARKAEKNQPLCSVEVRATAGR